MATKSTYFVRFIAGLVLGCTSTGCYESREASTRVEFCSAISLYGMELTSESSPLEVAEVALVAIENEDLDSLVRLVATKRVIADVQKIINGNQAFRRSADDAPRTTAEVVAERINLLTPESRTVGKETIDGDEATVVVVGICDGEIRQQTLYFTRENELWKLVPSQRSTKTRG